jgi:hypothetical protein
MGSELTIGTRKGVDRQSGGRVDWSRTGQVGRAREQVGLTQCPSPDDDQNYALGKFDRMHRRIPDACYR